MAKKPAGVWSNLLSWYSNQDQQRYEGLIVENDIEEGAVDV